MKKLIIFLFFAISQLALAEEVNHIGVSGSVACRATETMYQCWGGTKSDFRKTIAGYQKIKKLIVSGYNACVLDADEEVWCWGTEQNEVLDIPREIYRPKDIAVDHPNACAIVDEKIFCWAGKIKKNVPDLPSPTKIAVSSNYGCAMNAETIKCWGETELPFAIPDIKNPQEISMREYNACAIHGNDVTCWGPTRYNVQSPSIKFKNPRNLQVGSKAACVIDDEGVKCWGENHYNLLKKVPKDLVNPRGLSMGTWSACVLHDHGINCWGESYNGQFNIPTTW